MGMTPVLLADICVGIGMAIFLWNLINRKENRLPCVRRISAVFGSGFVIGMISAGIRGINAFMVLGALGLILSYTAFLFTFVERRSEADGI